MKLFRVVLILLLLYFTLLNSVSLQKICRIRYTLKERNCMQVLFKIRDVFLQA